MRVLAPAALAAAAVAVLALWSPWSPGGRRYDALFDAVPGLVRGADVRMAGLRVGHVTAIHLDHDRPRVTLRLEDGVVLRRGARADLRLASVSGEFNRFVAVSEGRGPVLPQGTTLIAAATDQPVEIDDLLGTLDPSTRAEARGLLRGLARATAGRGDAVAAALAHSARALRATSGALGQVTADGQALRTLVAATRRASAALASAPGATSAAVEQLARALGDTAARQRALAAGVAGLPAGLRAPRRALATLRGELDDLRALVADARPGVRELRAAAPELRAALAEGRPALAEAARLTATAPADLRKLRPLLPVAQRVLGRLEPVLRQAAPVLDETRVRLPDFFSFFSNWADFTSNYDANGHAARVGIVLPSAPLNEVGPDDNGAGHLAAPFVRVPGALEGEPWRDYRSSFAGAGG